tara:strand:- start:333 stop:542 length:210 start_codon:yes stop_codon:yes gene_type:complete
VSWRSLDDWGIILIPMLMGSTVVATFCRFSGWIRFGLSHALARGRFYEPSECTRFSERSGDPVHAVSRI